MANLSEDIQSAGSDTRPPILDRSDFESWQQRIRLYCMGKDNWENIIKSVDEGPFKMGKVRENTLVKLNSKFVNNMLPEWGRFVTAVKLNRGLKASNYDKLYAYLSQHEAHANEKKMMLGRYSQHAIDPLSLVSNVSPQQYLSQSSATP
ncbi:hypothetical protein Tco_1539847 [Tanacetum coccineum]